MCTHLRRQLTQNVDGFLLPLQCKGLVKITKIQLSAHIWCILHITYEYQILEFDDGYYNRNVVNTQFEISEKAVLMGAGLFSLQTKLTNEAA